MSEVERDIKSIIPHGQLSKLLSFVGSYSIQLNIPIQSTAVNHEWWSLLLMVFSWAGQA